MPVKNQKSWRQSKTILFNSLVMLASALAVWFSESAELFKSVLTERQYMMAMLVVALINILLRSKTHTPLQPIKRKR